jgi:hypothetical protein
MLDSRVLSCSEVELAVERERIGRVTAWERARRPAGVVRGERKLRLKKQ